jgi:beta-lactamase superfamily II metal-dependent hydrolase
MLNAQAVRKTLDIFYVDVEGGAATLIVTPAGESILVDAGWPGQEGRDAKRIQAAMTQAGITQIDHLINTHYHIDHYGGIPELAKVVKIINFYDRGAVESDSQDKPNEKLWSEYQAATNGKSIAIKAGDVIKLKTVKGMLPLKLSCLASSTKVAGVKSAANAACATAEMKPADTSDNARSVVLKLSYGAFDFFDAGDLTWNIESQLVCPANLIGNVDLYQVTHHGMDISNNPVLLKTISPTVAIMNNGPKKGGSANTVKWLRELPSLQALYQVHRNIATTDNDNTAPEFIANIEPTEENMIWVNVDAKKKTFSVTNGRTKQSKNFPIK